MEFFTTPNSKNIIATLHIVTIEKSELTFLLILYFPALAQVYSCEFCEISKNTFFYRTPPMAVSGNSKDSFLYNHKHNLISS